MVIHRVSVKPPAQLQCPVCGGGKIEAFFDISQVPVHCNLLWPKRDDALSAPRGEIRLGFCHQCGHIYNLTFSPDLMHYSIWYENSLHFSSRFQSYARSIAERLIDRYDLHNKEIIEIGSGKGEFLGLLCELGNNRGIGFDPGYVEPGGSPTMQQVTFIQDYYSEQYARYQADLICCRQTLEHLYRPGEFVAMLRRSIGDRKTVAFFEVPNVLFMLRGLSVWDVIYEHYSYFSAGSLVYLFTANGFGVLSIEDTYEGQYLTLEVEPKVDSSSARAVEERELTQLYADVSTFQEHFKSRVTYWQQQLGHYQAEGKRVVVWGAGSKGVTFLNALGVKSEIEYVVDINPRKTGMHVAGTGQKIVDPSFLRAYRPDAILIMNPIYENEIRAQARALDLEAEFLLV